MLRLSIALLVFAVSICQSVHAQFTLNNGFNYLYKRTITIPKANVSGALNLTDFPVLLDITNVDLRSKRYCGKVNSDFAYDIDFAAGGTTTALSFEIESYDAGSGRLLVWVKVPSLTAATSISDATTIDLYYAGVTNARIVNPSSAAAWSNSYRGVWHLNEVPTNAVSQLRESSPNGKNLQSVNTPASVSGKIGNAVSFVRANSQQLFVSGTGTAQNIDLTANFTLSAWVNLSTNNIDQKIMTNQTSSNGYKMGIIGDATLELETKNAGSNVLNRGAAGGVALATSRWYYVTCVNDGVSYKTYVDGTLQRNYTATQASGVGAAFRIGVEAGGTNLFFNGLIDEPHVADVARSADWIKTEATNQNSPSTFYTITTTPVYAPNYLFWGGGTSSDWGTASNWIGGVVPSSSSNVVIATGTGNAPTLSVASTAIGSLYVEACIPLTIAGGRRLTVNGNLVTNGIGISPFATSSTGYGYINLGNSSTDDGYLTVAGDYAGDGFIYFKGSTTPLDNMELAGSWLNTGVPVGMPSTAANMNVNYNGNVAGATQIVYSALPYNNLRFGNASNKTLAGSVTVNGRWHAVGVGKVDVSNAVVNFSGSSPQTISDAGSDAGNGVVFKTVNFSGGNLKTINGSLTGTYDGKISIAADGVLTITDQGTTIGVQGNRLILKSNALSSATVSPIPAGSSISGNVYVERFVKGSNDLTKRGYRLISPSVYTATVSIGGTSVRSYDPNYLLNSSFVSGLNGTANGFNVAGNPTLYLYREDIVPTGTTFTSGNYQGIASLSTTTPFAVTTQNRVNINYTSDTTVNIPAATGMLFFFRGDKTNNATATGTKVAAPFDFPEDVTLSSLGQLNQGTVNARTWFAKANQNLLQYSTSIANNVSPRNVRGYHLLGNPYASAINWNKLNRNGSSSSLFGPNIEPSVWFFNPTNKQYEVYLDGSPASSDTTATIALGTGSASNIIASGQGFFIRTKSEGSTFRFMEAAKTIAQPPVASLNKLMGIAVSDKIGKPAIIRLQLKQDSTNDDDILIRFNGNASENYLADEDAEDLGGNGAQVSLSSFSGDKKTRLAINAMPDVNHIKRIFLYADATTSGLFELRKKEIAGFPERSRVWLKDNFTGDSLDFKTNSTYPFRIARDNPATYGEKRFELIFTSEPLSAYSLLNFSGKKGNNEINISWSTKNEYDRILFTLEKQTEGNTFTAVYNKQGNGKGDYAFTDKAITAGDIKYRLKQTDESGKVFYSNILKFDDNISLTLYPNPVVSEIYISTSIKNIGEKNIRILDMQGRVQARQKFTQSTLKYSVGHFKTGTYTLELSTENNGKKLIQQKKFIKL